MEINYSSAPSPVPSPAEEVAGSVVSSEEAVNRVDSSNDVDSSTQSSSQDSFVSAIAQRVLFAQNRSEGIGKKEKKIFYKEIDSPTEYAWVKVKIRKWVDVNDDFLRDSKEREAALIIQNRTINILFYEALENISHDTEKMQTASFHVILNDNRDNPSIQAVSLFKTNESRVEQGVPKLLPLYVSYLSSAPWNLRVKASAGHKLKVEGAASALIESAIYESMKIGTRGAVALESVSSAVEFYKKLGFEPKEWEPTENDLIPMELSEEKAAEFLNSRRAGRALPYA